MNKIEIYDHIYVFCGNLAEFKYILRVCEEQWLKQIQQGKVHYISDVRELKGVPPARVFLYGTWYDRPDFQVIDAELKARGHQILKLR